MEFDSQGLMWATIIIYWKKNQSIKNGFLFRGQETYGFHRILIIELTRGPDKS